MKRAIISSLLVFLFWNLCYAQPNTFYGLELGKCYDKDQISTIVKNNGIQDGIADMDKEEENNPLGLITYFFNDVHHGGRYFPVMTAHVLPSDNKLVNVTFIDFTDEEYLSSAQLEEKYKSILDSLKRIYPMEKVDIDSPDLVRYFYNNKLRPGPTVRLDKYLSNGVINVIEICYLSTLDMVQAVLEKNPVHPNIQDTFFGLKMWNKYTHSQVKLALSENGKFLGESSGVGENSVTFTDVYFAGYKWDYCAFSLSGKNELYIVSFYNSYATYEYEEESATKKSFQSLKSRLDDKYGESETRDVNGKLSTFYFGGNDMAIMLSKEKSKSMGGSYRNYFKLTYYQTAVGSSQSKADDDEL